MHGKRVALLPATDSTPQSSRHAEATIKKAVAGRVNGTAHGGPLHNISNTMILQLNPVWFTLQQVGTCRWSSTHPSCWAQASRLWWR